MKELDKLSQLTKSHGTLRLGQGSITGAVGDDVPNRFFMQLACAFRRKA